MRRIWKAGYCAFAMDGSPAQPFPMDRAEIVRLADESMKIAAGIPAAPEPKREHIQACLNLVGMAATTKGATP